MPLIVTPQQLSQRAELYYQLGALADLAYPALIFHVAFLLLPIEWLQRLVLRGDLFSFVVHKLSFFLPFYGAAFLLIYACQSRRGEKWRALIETVARPIPVLG